MGSFEKFLPEIVPNYFVGVALLIACIILIIVLGIEIPLSGNSTPVLGMFPDTMWHITYVLMKMLSWSQSMIITITLFSAIFYVMVFLIVSISLIICAGINNFIIKSRSMYHPPYALKKVIIPIYFQHVCFVWKILLWLKTPQGIYLSWIFLFSSFWIDSAWSLCGATLYTCLHEIWKHWNLHERNGICEPTSPRGKFTYLSVSVVLVTK